MDTTRAFGILLHPTSLAGPYGIGTLGGEARRFVDWLAKARASYWQILPLCATGWGENPYLAVSTWAGNVALIDPEDLVRRGWLPGLRPPALPAERVAFPRVLRWKQKLLRSAYQGFCRRALGVERESFDRFRQREASWLAGYSLFMAIGEDTGSAPWSRWPEPLRRRDPAALAETARALADSIAFHEWAQWLFFQQWEGLRAYARDHGIQIIGDIPIFVSLHSADVWAHQEFFFLDPDGNPTVVGGVPPDYFSETGQRWGNPLYRWEILETSGFAWWIERVRAVLRTCDWIRIDHFRAFEAYWEIPASEPTAVRGRWVKAPGRQFFTALRLALGEVPIIAEDLGYITDEVRALRDQFGFPGMKVLQFAFDGDESNAFLPHHFPADGNCVVYTGTHDNDTTLGWYRALDPPRRRFLRHYLGREHLRVRKASDAPWALIRLALQSRSRLAILPLQDVMSLGAESRMNRPAEARGNWAWRYREEMLSGRSAARLRDLAQASGRN